MDEMTTMYQRIRTLALQSANGTNSDKDRGALQEEVNQLCAEVDRITKDTTFGGEKILTGEKSASKDFALAADTKVNRASATVDFQVGADANQKISVNLGNKKNGADGIVGFTVADLAYANGATADTKDVTKGGYLKDNSVGTGLTFDISTAAGAQNTLANIDKYIQAVDSKRAELGAVQNRLESTIRNQSNVSENVSDARSRIRDTDFATETANMTQQSIIQQASQSILSQANQRPQLALSLLG